jgi:hypothetical protein
LHSRIGDDGFARCTLKEHLNQRSSIPLFHWVSCLLERSLYGRCETDS